jgi:hypothetical protein
MSIEAAMEMFRLPDLRGALADFLTRANDKDPFQIGGHRVGNVNSPLPFDNLQVWTKVQVQNRSYFPPHHILPPQTINASPPSGSWMYGRSDIVLINTDNGKVWPQSGLEGHIPNSSLYLICTDGPNLVQGIVSSNYNLFFVPFHPEEFHLLLAQTYFLPTFSVLTLYLSEILQCQLEKVCILTHQQECMS